MVNVMYERILYRCSFHLVISFSQNSEGVDKFISPELILYVSLHMAIAYYLALKEINFTYETRASANL